ncbi:MAG TPA: FAD-dependent oxidoreductase [Caulobacteraceae bacterium]|jgi:succinate dehydrogenase/fumarate reductase flavoprotein subunit|nr:FAD-dependent oxidoreductase [Caulobacteraceae bacterium]
MAIDRRELLRRGGAAAAGGAVLAPAAAADAATVPVRWTREADIVVIGSGATGMTAAIAAREAGASVIVLEAEPDIGGHAICSGGHVALGGGTSVQKKYGIVDSPDILFRDLIDWTVVQPSGGADYRFNDHEIIRAFADNSAKTFEFLLAHGVTFADKAPDNFGGHSIGGSAMRENHAVPLDVPLVQTGQPAPPAERRTMSTGNGLMRPLEASARKIGVEILLEHRMTSLHRQAGGPVTGVAVTHKGQRLDVRARKAVILATGGSTGNVEFRRMFDPRLTEEYCGTAGMPWSNQDASGEIAGMAVGAALWGLANQTGQFGWAITKAGTIGCQYGYTNNTWYPGSRVFPQARATGLRVKDWQDLILVNMIGNRFYDETEGQFTSNNQGSLKDYVQGSWRNAANNKYNPQNFINAALAGIGDGKNGGGPIWAIFDADAVAREGWTPQPPNVDYAEGFFFSANSIPELARKIVMKHQRVPMPPEALERTVARYNGFVDAGKDADFDKPAPKYKIAKGPFYAAWATPVLHDTRAGLRINAKCQVVDMHGKVIPGLYCGGESAGGFSQHGVARATCQGFIAGHEAAGVAVA